ncbi:MAG TPA: peptidase T [Solirubrobacteraceae bacterium]|nr:peptidase T [Solirubrobacteraceae bacterium]
MDGSSFTSELAAELAEPLLERFTRYVRVDTQSDRAHALDRVPSSDNQLVLARMLVSELREAGLADAALDEQGVVMATLPAVGGADDGPVIGLIAHLDTSPDAPGAGVEPIVHRGYDGSPIELPKGGTRLDPETMEALRAAIGHDVITSSGDTLLGADDKAGVAEIVTAVAHLAAHPELPRPTIRVAFTPDEEVGQGGHRISLERFGADCAYTLDGSELGGLQDETFSADEATLTVTGVDIHPGTATGKLVNALRIASEIVAALPSDRLTPETTSGREGFLHPYEFSGSAGRATVTFILRDFDEAGLRSHAELLRSTAERVAAREPRARVEVTIREQYRNMRTALDRVPDVVAAGEAAIRAEGLEPLREPIRGGTDGSILTARGLPTPNLFTGGHEFHSPREWASLQEMAAAAAMIVRLAGIWASGELTVTGGEPLAGASR